MFQALKSFIQGKPKYESVVQAMLAGDHGVVYHWHLKQASPQNPGAAYNLANIYRDGRGTPVNMAEYRKWLRDAADWGSVDAIFEIINSIPEDEIDLRLDEILRRLKDAAEVGSAEAMRLLGDFYSTGKRLPIDAEKAVAYYTAAAERHDLDAMCYLGEMYQTGEIVPKDSVKAAKWYQEMVDRDDPTGKVLLGNLYSQGEGVPKSEFRAKDLFEEAANQGSKSALHALGMLHITCTAMPQDLVVAYMWLNLAAPENEAAAQLRDSVEEKLSQEELGSAQKRAAEWLLAFNLRKQAGKEETQNA